jgi:UDP-GlcNAc:undecaprenyl-phosphate GlcNAc-1-phosphate transferase
MTTILLIFISALVFAVGGTPLARWLAVQLDIVAQPSPRKIHQTPMPLLGGAAIYAAFVLALLLFEERFRIPQLISILLGATWVSFLGVWDDRRGLRPLLKLLGQVVAAGILIATGIAVTAFSFPWFNLAVTILWIVGITNAMNLLDNMDGLAGGIGAVASAFFLLLAALSGQYLVGGLSAALLGACLGFLVYNFNPASIFMGDTGSLFLGFVLAAVGIKLRFPANTPLITWMVPVLVLGIPILDTTLVTFSRIKRGVNPFTGGKDHISHRLVSLGLTQREAVMVLCLASGALGMIAILVTNASLTEAYGLIVAVALIGAAAIWKLEQVKIQ